MPVKKSPIPTPREREVFTLFAEGKRCKEVARVLGLSPVTVRTHLKVGMERLGAESVAHAVGLFKRMESRPCGVSECSWRREDE